jgi:uncharacterized protein (DUF1778 family)
LVSNQGDRRIDKIDKTPNFTGMSRLTIEIAPEQHRQIKTLATFAGMTIKDFILAKTLAVQSDAAGDTTDRLLGSPENAARLLEAISTPTPPHLVFKSTEELRHALGI